MHIAINAPVHIGSPDLAGLALDTMVPEMIPGVGSDIKDPNSKELAYAELPVATLRQIYVLCAVTQDLLPRVKCPTLLMHSRDDHIVSPTNGPRIVQQIGTKQVELVWLENSFHVATIDNDKAEIFERTAAFIRSIAGR